MFLALSTHLILILHRTLPFQSLVTLTFSRYGLLFEDEITLAKNPRDVYIAHCRMMMALRRDMLISEY